MDRDGRLSSGGTYRTPNGVIAGVMDQAAAAWNQSVTHDDTYVVDAERVVVLARYSAVNKATGKAIWRFG